MSPVEEAAAIVAMSLVGAVLLFIVIGVAIVIWNDQGDT